jgi:8-oxo-dGTP pyrophosphatase MutT (NUDIX family)
MIKETMRNAPARAASTVILARQGLSGLEIYLLRRSSESKFFPGKYVFPGGAVDPEDTDADFWRNRVDLKPLQISEQMGGDLSVEEALGHGVAAIRETFEEAGVLLVEEIGGKKEEIAKMCGLRSQGRMSNRWLKEWVISGGGTLSLSSLMRWSHWVTPEAMKPRFDTRFYIGLMPSGQECYPDTREMTHGVWIRAEDALTGNLRGAVPLSPPTLVTLQELLPYGGLHHLERDARGKVWGEPRLPRFIRVEQGAMILEPWDPMMNEEVEIDPARLETRVLPAGHPFSRMWLHNGIWKPVGI